jgi:hypothetical protein
MVKKQFLLTRNDRSIDNTLSFATSSFDIPFNCFVARKDTTLLEIQDLHVSQSTASYSPGMITVGSQCGDKSLRSFLNGNFPVLFESIIPNPANGKVNIIIDAAQSQDIVVSLVNNLGEVSLRKNLSLLTGKNIEDLDLSSVKSGSYQLVLSLSGENISSQLIEIIH